MSYLVELLLASAEDAQSRGDERVARQRFAEVLKSDPQNLSARHGLALLDSPEIETTVGSAHPEDLEPTVAHPDIEPDEPASLARTVAGVPAFERTVVSDRDEEESELEPTVTGGAVNLAPPRVQPIAVAVENRSAPPSWTRTAEQIFGPSRPPRYLGIDAGRRSIRPFFAVAVVVAVAAVVASKFA